MAKEEKKRKKEKKKKEKKEGKEFGKTGKAALFLLGVIAGRHGIPVMTHALYLTLILVTFIYSGGIVQWISQ